MLHDAVLVPEVAYRWRVWQIEQQQLAAGDVVIAR
jgi:hypothetical protein